MRLPLLFTVEDAFQISGRGCVLVPGIGKTSEFSPVRVGDRIRLVKPNGEVIDTRIQGVEMINYGRRGPPKEIFAPILLPGPISKHDVPPGTHVYYLDDRER
jgi:hypothetical protein